MRCRETSHGEPLADPSPPSAGCSLARRARRRAKGSTRPPFSPLPPPLRFAGRASPPLRRDRGSVARVGGRAKKWGLARRDPLRFQGLAGRDAMAQPFHRSSRRRPGSRSYDGTGGFGGRADPVRLASRPTIWIPAFAGMSGSGVARPLIRLPSTATRRQLAVRASSICRGRRTNAPPISSQPRNRHRTVSPLSSANGLSSAVKRSPPCACNAAN